MPNPIYTNDIFDDSKIQKAEAQLIALNDRFESIQKAAIKLKETLNKTNPNNKNAVDQASKQAAELERREKALAATKTELGQKIAVLKEEQRQANREAKVAAQLHLSVKNSLDEEKAAMARLSIELGKYSAEQKRTIPEVKKMVDEHNRLRASVLAQEQQLGIHTRSVGNYGIAINKLWGSLKNLLGVYLGLTGAQRLFSSIFRNTKELDAIDFAIKKVITDSNELAQTQQFLSEVTEQYGLDILNTTQSYTKFRAATKTTNLSIKETQKIFESFAKTSAILGLNGQSTREVFLALEQIISKGKVSSEELRRQLGEKVPGAMSIMAKAIGVTVGELDGMLKRGEVLSEDALPKFAAEMEKTFGIENVNNVNTLTAAQNRFHNSWIDLIDAFKASGALQNVFNTLASGIGFIKDNLTAIKQLTKAVFALSVGYAALGLTRVFQNFTLLTTAITRARTAIIALNIAVRANPFGVLVSAISAAATAYFLFREEIDKTQSKLKETDASIDIHKKKVESLFTALTNVNSSEAARKTAIERIQKEYPDYLGNLDLERASLEQIRDLQNEIATGGSNLIALRNMETELNSVFNQIVKVNKELDELQPSSGRSPGLSNREIEIRDAASRSGRNPDDAIQAEINRLQGLETELNERFDSIQAGYKKFLTLFTEADKESTEGASATVVNGLKRELELRQLKIDLLKDGAKKELLQLRLNTDKRIAQAEGDAEKILLIEKKYQQDYLALLGSFSRQLLEPIERISNNIVSSVESTTESGLKRMSEKIAEFKEKETPTEEDIIDIWSILGIDISDEGKQALNQAFNFATSQLLEFSRLSAQLADERLRRADNAVSIAQRNLQAELQLERDGYASRSAFAVKELDDARKLQAKAEQDKRKAVKDQLALDALTQTSSLITATAQIWTYFKGNPLAAIGATALMFGSFAAAKIKAFQLANKQEFGKGTDGVEMVGGGTHASGDDTYIGSIGGKPSFVEKGETLGVTSAKMVRKYGKTRLDHIQKSINQGDFFENYSIKAPNHVSDTHYNINTDLGSLEGGINRLVRQGEDQTLTYTKPDGTLVVKYKNRTATYRNG